MNDLVTLETAVRGFARAARAPATVRAYASDMRVFASWCETHGFNPLRPAPSIVAGFLADSAGQSSVGTVSRRVAAIAHFCRAAGLPSPIDDSVREVLRGIRRQLGSAPTGAKDAISLAALRRMVDTCHLDLDSSVGLRRVWLGMRDRALLLLGFAGAFRRSELAALDVEHIEHTASGLLVHLTRSKTDQEGKGQDVAIIPAKDVRYCPVDAVLRLIALVERGPLFRDVYRQKRLSGFSIAMIVKRRAALAGLDPTAISAHSLRAGFVTAASSAGANILKVAEHTRHKNLQSVKRYFRGDLFENHAGEKLL